jgi:8-oxo-dGTP pyrophosphatase MutT (NUDIX family)
MNIPRPEVNTDCLPIPVLKAASLARQAIWHALGADLEGAGLIAQDADTGDILIIGQTYGPKGAWYMPGGGVHETPEDTAIGEFKQEIRPTDDVVFSPLKNLDTSENVNGRVTDKFGVFWSEATGLNSYIESIRELPVKNRRKKMSNEIARLWMVPPDWLAEQGKTGQMDLHHGLRAGLAKILN